MDRPIEFDEVYMQLPTSSGLSRSQCFGSYVGGKFAIYGGFCTGLKFSVLNDYLAVLKLSVCMLSHEPSVVNFKIPSTDLCILLSMPTKNFILSWSFITPEVRLSYICYVCECYCKPQT